MNGLTNESENALPLDETIWAHIEHMNYTIGIPVSDTRTLNILGALEDIYWSVDTDPEDAKHCIVTLAGIFLGGSVGKADKVWEEFAVQDAMKTFNAELKEILDEEA